MSVSRRLHSYARARARRRGRPATSLLAELRGWGSSGTATCLATARTRLRCELARDFPLLDSTGERAPSGAANFLFAKSAGRRRWPRPRPSYWSSRRIWGLCFATRRRPTALTQLPESGPVSRRLHSYARARARRRGRPATSLLAELRGWGSSGTATCLATARTRLRCELARDFPLLDSTGERAPSGAANFLFAKSAGRRRWPRPRPSYWSSRRIWGLCFATRRRPTALTQLPESGPVSRRLHSYARARARRRGRPATSLLAELRGWGSSGTATCLATARTRLRCELARDFPLLNSTGERAPSGAANFLFAKSAGRRRWPRPRPSYWSSRRIWGLCFATRRRPTALTQLPESGPVSRRLHSYARARARRRGRPATSLLAELRGWGSSGTATCLATARTRLRCELARDFPLLDSTGERAPSGAANFLFAKSAGRRRWPRPRPSYWSSRRIWGLCFATRRRPTALTQLPESGPVSRRLHSYARARARRRGRPATSLLAELRGWGSSGTATCLATARTRLRCELARDFPLLNSTGERAPSGAANFLFAKSAGRRRWPRPRPSYWSSRRIWGLCFATRRRPTALTQLPESGPVSRRLHSYARARARRRGRPATSLLAELRGWGSSGTATCLATARTRLRCELARDFPLLDSTGERAPSGAANFLFAKSAGRRRWPRPRPSYWSSRRIWGLCFATRRRPTALTQLPESGPVSRRLHSYARARARRRGRPATSLLAELRGWGSSGTATCLATARTRLRCELARDFPLLDSTGERAPSGAANFLFAKSAGRRRWPRPRPSYWSSRRIWGLCFATRRRPTALTQLPEWAPLAAVFIPTRARGRAAGGGRRRRCWPSCEVGGRREPPPVSPPLGPVSGVSSLGIFRCSIPLVSGRRAARRISFLPNRLADGGGLGPGRATGRAAGSGVSASPPGGAPPH